MYVVNIYVYCVLYFKNLFISFNQNLKILRLFIDNKKLEILFTKIIMFKKICKSSIIYINIYIYIYVYIYIYICIYIYIYIERERERK